VTPEEEEFWKNHNDYVANVLREMIEAERRFWVVSIDPADEVAELERMYRL
jgi:hypothetical protein